MSFQFIRNWFSRIVSPQNLVLAAVDAQLKPESLRQAFQDGKIQEIEDLGELKDLGFRFEKFGKGKRIVGQSGTLIASTFVPPFKYHFAYGRKDPNNNRVPVIIYAETDPAFIPPAPKRPIDPKLKDEKIMEEFDKKQKQYNAAVSQRNQMIDAVNVAVEQANSRLGKWILFVDASRVTFAAQEFDLSKYLKKKSQGALPANKDEAKASGKPVPANQPAKQDAKKTDETKAKGQEKDLDNKKAADSSVKKESKDEKK